MSTEVTDPMLGSDEMAAGMPEEGAPPMAGGKRRSAWMSHVKATMKANKGMKLMQVLKMAKKTYKKRGGGGMGAPLAGGGGMGAPMEGGRRRRGTRRGGRRGTRRSRKY